MDTLTLGEADDGKPLALQRGQRVLLRLPETPTTGYRWEPPPEVTLLADDFAPLQAEAAAGTGGMRTLCFELASATTTGPVRFELRRAWGGGPPAGSFTLQVTVQD
jgi:inhibitor of cysteine peptidase